MMLENMAIPIQEYKELLSTYIIDGKQPKKKQQRKVTGFPDINDEAIQNTIMTLMSLGYSKNEAKSKVDIAIESGLRFEQDIIKAILAM